MCARFNSLILQLFSLATLRLQRTESLSLPGKLYRKGTLRGSKAQIITARVTTRENKLLIKTRVGGTPLCDLNGDVRPDRVWFSGCFVLNRVSISSFSVLNRVSLHYLMA